MIKRLPVVMRESKDNELRRADCRQTDLHDHSPFKDVLLCHGFAQSDIDEVGLIFLGAGQASLLPDSIQKAFDHRFLLSARLLHHWARKQQTGMLFFVDSSIILNRRRTGTYLHSLSFPASVRAPQTRVPFSGKAANGIYGFTGVGIHIQVFLIFGSDFSTGAITAFRLTLAGAFQTPRCLSVVA